MAMNIMGNYRNTNEQDLVSDLIEEAIEQRGIEVHYILRDMINPDYLLGEASISEFKEFYLIPMFLESMEHFGGNGDVWDQMGINYTDASIFQVGARKFRIDIGDKTDLDRPREGDLVYLPFSDSLWEISKVKMDLKYYQTGKNHSYRLVCKLFEYSHEKIEANTETDFNGLGTEDTLDDNAMKTLLGITADSLQDETEILVNEIKPLQTFDATNPFGF